MTLLEREPILAQLDGLLRDAANGTGQIAAIAGEAGVGRTSLVEHFVATHAADSSPLWGLCDPLFTPRPLGPLHDMAKQTNGPLAAAVHDGTGRERLLSAFLSELALPPAPRVIVVEDAHWVDDATLDLLKFVGRRIRGIPSIDSACLCFRRRPCARWRDKRVARPTAAASLSERIHSSALPSSDG